MKQLVSVPFNLFWWFNSTSLPKHSLGRYRRYFSTIKAVQGTHRELFSEADLLVKRQKNIGIRFSSNSQACLMDFDVWLTPKFFNLISSYYNYWYVLRKEDRFSIIEFARNSGVAVKIVTHLMSQTRFSELEGLLTQECIQKVEENLKSWSVSKLSCLAYEPVQEVTHCPCDISVFSDKEDTGKLFTEVRVIHYIWLKLCTELCDYEDIVKAKKMLNLNDEVGNMYIGAVFNSKFLKEITNGSTDGWIISAINLKVSPQLVKTF